MWSILPFLAVAVLVLITPGPDMALVTRNALSRGRSAALMTAIGVEVGLLGWTLASAVGLAAVLRTSALLFTVVKLAGAAYLTYLGIRTLVSLRTSSEPPVNPTPRRRLPEGTPFQQGVLSNLLNPKIAVFFTSLIPQFVQPGSHAVAKSALLAGIFVVMGFFWLAGYALFASAAGGLMGRAGVRRAMDAITGTVLVGLGVRVALERR